MAILRKGISNSLTVHLWGDKPSGFSCGGTLNIRTMRHHDPKIADIDNLQVRHAPEGFEQHATIIRVICAIARFALTVI